MHKSKNFFNERNKQIKSMFKNHLKKEIQQKLYIENVHKYYFKITIILSINFNNSSHTSFCVCVFFFGGSTIQ